jgi:hypothetical protein
VDGAGGGDEPKRKRSGEACEFCTVGLIGQFWVQNSNFNFYKQKSVSRSPVKPDGYLFKIQIQKFDGFKLIS